MRLSPSLFSMPSCRDMHAMSLVGLGHRRPGAKGAQALPVARLAPHLSTAVHRRVMSSRWLLSVLRQLPTANCLQVRLEQARAASEELDRMFAEAAKAAAQGDRQDEEAEVGCRGENGWWGRWGGRV